MRSQHEVTFVPTTDTAHAVRLGVALRELADRVTAAATLTELSFGAEMAIDDAERAWLAGVRRGWLDLARTLDVLPRRKRPSIEVGQALELMARWERELDALDASDSAEDRGRADAFRSGVDELRRALERTSYGSA